MSRAREQAVHPLRHCFQLFFVDVKIRINILHVVVLFQRFAQPQHGGGVLAFQLDGILGYHRDFGLLGGNARFFQRLQNGFMRFGRRKNFPRSALIADVVAARFKIVEGAVSMVQSALQALSERKIVELDEERKAAMVNNLLVALVSDKDSQPVLNTGSLY